MGHWTVALAFFLITNSNHSKQESAKVEDWAILDLRLLTKIEQLDQYLEQTHLDNNIGPCTILNQTVNRGYQQQLPGLLASMVSEA